MGLAGQAGQDARRLADEADRQAGLGQEDADLVVRSEDLEAGVRRHEGDEPHGRQPGRHPDHVLLGRTHLQEALRVGSGEHPFRGRRRVVGVEHDHPGILIGQLREGPVERLAEGEALHEIDHFSSLHRAPPAPVRARRP